MMTEDERLKSLVLAEQHGYALDVREIKRNFTSIQLAKYGVYAGYSWSSIAEHWNELQEWEQSELVDLARQTMPQYGDQIVAWRYGNVGDRPVMKLLVPQPKPYSIPKQEKWDYTSFKPLIIDQHLPYFQVQEQWNSMSLMDRYHFYHLLPSRWMQLIPLFNHEKHDLEKLHNMQSALTQLFKDHRMVNYTKLRDKTLPIYTNLNAIKPTWLCLNRYEQLLFANSQILDDTFSKCMRWFLEQMGFDRCCEEVDWSYYKEQYLFWTDRDKKIQREAPGREVLQQTREELAEYYLANVDVITLESLEGFLHRNISPCLYAHIYVGLGNEVEPLRQKVRQVDTTYVIKFRWDCLERISADWDKWSQMSQFDQMCSITSFAMLVDRPRLEKDPRTEPKVIDLWDYPIYPRAERYAYSYDNYFRSRSKLQHPDNEERILQHETNTYHVMYWWRNLKFFYHPIHQMFFHCAKKEWVPKIRKDWCIDYDEFDLRFSDWVWSGSPRNWMLPQTSVVSGFKFPVLVKLEDYDPNGQEGPIQEAIRHHIEAYNKAEKSSKVTFEGFEYEKLGKRQRYKVDDKSFGLLTSLIMVNGQQKDVFWEPGSMQWVDKEPKYLWFTLCWHSVYPEPIAVQDLKD
jgi:hypothetical protein